ncbi:LysM peptidoglycan-binding domain-containing protein [Acidocella sp.]|uniref:LysM peptidoglycan-binding domain-containing protein n=1 Tax=Acidocella sp. TaxID=50710 RepID=UPI0026138D6C|nr:LysM peptidoglycan-binding domain-containing protein [Acidocella sp.]
MASDDTNGITGSPTPKGRDLRLIFLIVLAVLALGGGVLLLYLHYGRSHAPPAPVVHTVPAPLPPPAANATILPSFDIVRVDPQGNAVLAGRAVPGAKVMVKDGTVVIGTTMADAQGAFVLIPASPLPPGSHELTLSETLRGGQVLNGTQSASISLSGNGQPALAVVSGQNGSNVVTGQGPQPGQLGMGAVDYDAQGHALFSGTAPAGANVTVMLDRKTLGTAKADGSGRWHLQAPVPAAPGMITLNATAPDGSALTPIIVPFAPEELSKALKDGHVIIAPGDNLWMIARRVYGKGTLYTLIYSANAGQIHNPNLIFPGQAFTLPKKQAN